MGSLVYTALCSLDGYVVDDDGRFEWAAPDSEVHQHVNDAERDVGTYLLGRRMYEVLRYWGGPDPVADKDPVIADYRRVWQAADKVVHSTTLEEVTTPRTELRRRFDVDEVSALLASTPGPVSVGGPTLAAHALAAGLVSELRLYRFPVVVGGGTSALPPRARLSLELVEARTFASGVCYTHHRVRR